MGVYYTLEGFKELEDTLLEISQTVKRPDLLAKNVFKPAMTAALEPVLLQVQTDAPYDTHRKSNLDAHGKEKPHLRDTAKIDARFPNESDKRSSLVRDTDAYIATVTVKKSAVSLSQEFGNARTPPHPFIRDAFDFHIDKVTSILKSKIEETLPVYLAKLSRYKGFK